MESCKHEERGASVPSRFEWDLASDRVWWSVELADVLGRDAPVSYATLLERVHGEDRDAVELAIERAVVDGAPYRLEHRVVHPGGSVLRVIHEGHRALAPDGAPCRLEGTLRAIDAEVGGPCPYVRASSQSERLESLGRAVSGVAHDFNNLLTAILCNVDQLLPLVDSAGDLAAVRPLMAEGLAEILAAAERASGLTRQLLVFSRGHSAEPRAIEVNETIAGLGRMLRRLIPENIALAFALDPAPTWVALDRAQLEQIVMNLVLNARDAVCPGGTIAVRTKKGFVAGASEHFAPVVTIEVADTGHGMTEDVRSRCLDPFFTTKPSDVGTGLGLATVATIVSEANGTLSLESRPGNGTTVRVRLPTEGSPAQGARDAPIARSTLGSETVLVCEDEEVVRKIMCRAIAAHGYEVLEASSGPMALELLEAHRDRVKLLVTDVIMPSMDGTELEARIRGMTPHLPVLYASGYASDVLDRNAREIAPDDFLAKPFTPRELLARIRAKLDATAGA